MELDPPDTVSPPSLYGNLNIQSVKYGKNTATKKPDESTTTTIYTTVVCTCVWYF